MTPGEAAPTVIAMLEADIHGDLTEERFTQLLIGETDIAPSPPCSAAPSNFSPPAPSGIPPLLKMCSTGTGP